MRKILEERLENARNDFLNALKNGNATDREIGELQYTVTTYQDCLNLMQPRTEQEILKDFEKLGYEVTIEKNHIILNNCDVVIFIDLLNKRYDKSYYLKCNYFTIQEHKLLNELFICWGWL